MEHGVYHVILASGGGFGLAILGFILFAWLRSRSEQ
jgi:hypothetical protein